MLPCAQLAWYVVGHPVVPLRMWRVPIVMPTTAVHCLSLPVSFLSCGSPLFYHLFSAIVGGKVRCQSWTDRRQVIISVSIFSLHRRFFLFSSHSLHLSTVSQYKVEKDHARVVGLLVLSIDLFFSLFDQKLWGKVSHREENGLNCFHYKVLSDCWIIG